jgi:hypothetical protein
MQIHKDRDYISSCQVLGGITTDGYEVSFGSAKNILELATGDSCTTLGICLKSTELYPLNR